MIERVQDSVEAFLKEHLEADALEELRFLHRQDKQKFLAQVTQKPAQELMEGLAQAAGLQLMGEIELHGSATKQVPLRLMHEYQCLPLEKSDEHTLHLVTAWPPSERMKAWLFSVTGKQLVFYLGMGDTLTSTITESFGVGAGSFEDSDLEGLEVDDEEDEQEDENAAVIRFVNEIVQRAILDRATDIHFEPHKDELQIRYRIDGKLVAIKLPENLMRFKDAIISRIKIMAKLNISERRRPQDGRINYTLKGNAVDIRISTFPTLYGESISLRLLGDKNLPSTMDELGFLKDDQEKVTKALERPHGMVLVTGPTGSGKSTSLTAFLRSINSPERRIITVEDPVEYEIPGVNQTQIHHEIGLDFASALRHILRQDPDVIMVGEIRDRETAEIGIRASQTGHLVLSTLHTNDAAGAMTRLIDMEIEPFLIASSVELVIAQRLVRRLCTQCSQPSNMKESFLRNCLDALHINLDELKHANLAREPKGCKACNGLGFRGRVAINEVLANNDSIHELVVKKASARLIREEAISNGMRTLQQCGWEQVKRGLTAVQEIMKFAEIGEEL